MQSKRKSSVNSSGLLSKRSVSPESDTLQNGRVDFIEDPDLRGSRAKLFQARESIENNKMNININDERKQEDKDVENSVHMASKTSRSVSKIELLFNKSFLRTVRFPSEKISKLYKRYFYQLNQNFINWLLVILILTTISEVALHFSYNITDGFSYARGVFLSIQISIYAILLSIINWTGSSGRLLLYVSYILIFSNCLTIICNLALLPNNHHSITESVSFTMFVIYMTYVMLPLQIRVSVFCGLLLTVTHLVTSVASERETGHLAKLVSGGSPPNFTCNIKQKHQKT